MRSIVLLILLAIAPAVWCQTAGDVARSAIDIIDHCSDSADGETVGLADLENECPGLTQALEDSGYLSFLSASQRNTLDVDDLSDLVLVADWYREQAADDVDVSQLKPILDELRAEEPERAPGLLDRLQRWLRSLFERKGGAAEEDWLARWLDELDAYETVLRTILLVAMVLLVLLVIGVVYNELRAAGLLRKRPVVQDDPIDAATAASGDTELDKLSAERKASMLLRMLVTTLIRSGRLRTERGLTYRELSTRATFDDAQQREDFRRVATLAERTVYGGREIAAEEVEPVAAVAHALDARLRGAPT